ncbi:hypothetical protein V492_04631 [Pseudogymnoascus sp. VKM F-4246]|nr:hypothetical protein V492_04631 [Pseudogymnoascus sp. VKM F-4246]
MDASTQTTAFSGGYARPRSNVQPVNEEHKPRRGENGEVGMESENMARSGLHGNNHFNQRGPVASSDSSLTRATGDDNSGVAMPLPIKQTSKSLPLTSGKTGSTASLHRVNLQNDEKSAMLVGATDYAQAGDRHAVQGDTVPQVGTMHNSGQSLRRRPDAYSQTSGRNLAVPTAQDSVTMQRETYLLKVCRALMMYGAPTHRLEEYTHRSAEVLGLHLQSFYMPGCMIISFDDANSRTKDVHIIRCTESLNLCKLDDVHAVYKDIVHNKTTTDEAMARLHEIMDRRDKFPPWFLVLMYGLASACIGPVSFGARPIDLPMIFLLGCLLGFMKLILAEKSELYRHVFEISISILTSFLARALGSIRLGPSTTFCFSAMCQASLILILPGFTITNSALELQSKNMVSGSVRMVYGIIFTLFLAFGITIGITIYGAMDSGATSDTKCPTTWPFWWKIIFVGPFTICYIIINQGKWKKVPAMVILSLMGWTVNYFSAQRFNANTPIAQTLGALTVGIFANTYSRLGFGLAVALMYPAIFIQVPGSLAASGGLIGGLQSADELTRSGSGSGNTTAAPNTEILKAGFAMIQIAIGITAGLSVSALVVYPLRKRRGNSGLFSF